MPRVLVLCEYPTLLGGERSLLTALPAIAAADFDVHVAAPADGPMADVLRERGLPHHVWQAVDESGARLPLSRLRAGLTELFRFTRPALVHANSLSTARIAGPVARECRAPSIGHLRDIVKMSRQAVDDINAHRHLIAVSHATRDFHISQGLDAARCEVVYNGVDLKEFRPRESTGYLHRGLGLPTSALLVVTIGQLGLRKGTEVALAAAREVAERLPKIHWLIVGERTSNKEESCQFERQLHAAAAEQLRDGRVHFLGNRSDVSQLLPECALLVHAARQEPLGRVLLEAAACGVAVVATDVGGSREIFPGEADGAILVPPDDAAALAEAECALLLNNVRRRSLAEAARRRAERAFDIRDAARRLVELYQSVLI